MSTHETPSTSAAPHGSPSTPTWHQRLRSVLRWPVLWLRYRFVQLEWSALTSAAGYMASEKRRERVTVDDLVTVKLRDPSVMGTLALLGAGPADLERRLDEAITSAPPDNDFLGERTVRGETTTAFQRALMTGVPADHPSERTPVSLLLACLREEVCIARRVFADAGVPMRRIAVFVAHRMTHEPAVAEPGAKAAVIVLNDDVTPADAVCSLFQLVLKLPHDDSHPLMERVDREGRAVVFEGDGAAAHALCVELNRAAAERGLGLLATLEPRV